MYFLRPSEIKRITVYFSIYPRYFLINVTFKDGWHGAWTRYGLCPAVLNNGDRPVMHKIRQNGFTLIEVLISVFVLALGVIGAAGMQLVAMRTGQQSGLQTTALQLATEMADSMRQNASQMDQDDSTNPYIFTYQSASDSAPTKPGKLCYTTAANCSSAELASFDIYEWKNHIKERLPGGRAVICRDEAPWDATTGALTWDCTNSLSIVSNVPFSIKVGWQGKNPDGSLIKDFPPSVAISVQPYIK